jgi:isopenicillin-N N-acyltransferase like protein
VHADDVIPYASVGWPGLVGVVSGINAEGIAVMVHPARTADVRLSGSGQPVALLARDVLENARSLDDAIAVLEHARPLGAAAFVIVDGKTRTFAVVERSPTRVEVRRESGAPAVADILRGEAFADDPDNDRARRTRPSAMRAQRAAALLRGRPPADAAQAVAVLRDQRGPDDAPLPLGHRGAVEDIAAVHAALFDASGMVLWVSEGPGASGRFRAFDLRHELRGEGARPAPPADLPADPDLDAGQAHATLAAMAELADARRAWAAGDRRRARELVQRALARAPQLPDALRTAGELAQAAGDREAAARYWERYLEAGPDDLGAEQVVRGFVGR